MSLLRNNIVTQTTDCRSEFDLEYTLLNDPETGLPSYIGDKHSLIRYDEASNQWNISVLNNPDISAVCYSDLSR